MRRVKWEKDGRVPGGGDSVPWWTGAEEGGCSSAEAKRERKTFYYYSELEWIGQEGRDDRVVFYFSRLWAF
jgi:hypothetical protein